MIPLDGDGAEDQGCGRFRAMTRTCRSSPAPTRAPSKGSTRDRARARLRRSRRRRDLRRSAARSRQSSRACAARLPAPQIANIVFGGMTPDLGQAQLAEMGFSLVLYANAALQAALKASRDVLAALKQDGSSHAVADRLANFERAPTYRGQGNLRCARETLRHPVSRSAANAKPPMSANQAVGRHHYRRGKARLSRCRLRPEDRARFQPALLIIDVQYRTVGTTPKPFWQAIKEFPTSCGEVGWSAVGKIRTSARAVPRAPLAGALPYVSPKETFDKGRLPTRSRPS